MPCLPGCSNGSSRVLFRTHRPQVDIEPSVQTIRVIQDKFAQKEHFAKAGVPLPAFRNIKCRGCMEATGRNFGYPFMLKAKRWAGRGETRAAAKLCNVLMLAILWKSTGMQVARAQAAPLRHHRKGAGAVVCAGPWDLGCRGYCAGPGVCAADQPLHAHGAPATRTTRHGLTPRGMLHTVGNHAITQQQPCSHAQPCLHVCGGFTGLRTTARATTWSGRRRTLTPPPPRWAATRRGCTRRSSRPSSRSWRSWLCAGGVGSVRE